MSYILDALRRLERERRPQAVAGLMAAGAPVPARRAMVWPIVGGAALLVNVILLALLLWPAPAVRPHPDSPGAPAPTDAASRAPAATSSTAAAPAARPADTVPPPAVSVPSTEAPTEPASHSAAAAVAGPPASHPAPAAIPARPPSRPVPAPAVAPRPVAEQTPPVKAPEAGAEPEASRGAPPGVPRLKLEVLVYSETPADRFVFINGRKYMEGQSVSEGVTLEQINEDGAVLSYGGQPFVLRE